MLPIEVECDEHVAGHRAALLFNALDTVDQLRLRVAVINCQSYIKVLWIRPLHRVDVRAKQRLLLRGIRCRPVGCEVVKILHTQVWHKIVIIICENIVTKKIKTVWRFGCTSRPVIRRINVR